MCDQKGSQSDHWSGLTLEQNSFNSFRWNCKLDRLCDDHEHSGILVEVKGLSSNQFVFLCQLKTKSNFQFSFSQLDPVSLFLFPLGRILPCMTHTAFFYRDRRRLQTIREKCVLLICDTFGVLWFLSLEYVIFLLF